MMLVTSSLLAMALGGLISLIQQIPAFLLQIFLIMINYQKPSAPNPSNNSNGPPRVRVESRDFQMLSGLRGLAALVVLFRHINVGGYIGGYQGLEELGVFMVATFFVLSAFLLSVRQTASQNIPILYPSLNEFIVPRLERRDPTLLLSRSSFWIEKLALLQSLPFSSFRTNQSRSYRYGSFAASSILGQILSSPLLPSLATICIYRHMRSHLAWRSERASIRRLRWPHSRQLFDARSASGKRDGAVLESSACRFAVNSTSTRMLTNVRNSLTIFSYRST